MSNKIKLPASVRQALDAQHQRLFQAQGIVQSVQRALKHHFNGKAGTPLFDSALEAADALIEDIGWKIFPEELEAAAEDIEAKQEAGEAEVEEQD
jgi:hypothetical protein